MQLVNVEKLNVPFQSMVSLPLFRQLGLLLGLALSIAIGVYVVMWSMTPNYTTLYTSLTDRDANEVTDALLRFGIDHRIDAQSGAIKIDSSKLHQARMRLAAEGLPGSTNLGFEILEKDQGFATSQFLQTARYQRAIEGEIARTIMAMTVVKGARVHLALPRESSFIRDQRKASASVFVDLVAGRNLEEGQVAGIIHLVASSVPNLTTEGITVVDNKGNLLSNDGDSRDMAMSVSQFKYTQRLEKAYIKRIEHILSPVLGRDGMRAQVVADIDFTVTEQTQESFNPDLPAVRSEQKLEESSVGALAPAGIPGALSNQPPGLAIAPEQIGSVAGGGGQGPPKRSSRRSTVNYELDKTISHTRRAPGSIRHLSVAVVVNDKITISSKGKDKGKPVNTPRLPEEMERITSLVKDAIGFNTLRGDSVNVINIPFEPEPEIVPLPEPGFWEQAWFWTVLKTLGGGILLYMVLFGVLKPIMNSLASRPLPDAPEPLDEAALQLQKDEALRLAKQAGHDSDLDAAKSIVNTDPKLVAQVVKTWVEGE